ncbi:MAG: methylenetetrahydrofolate reductase [NAD(P)H] [Eubacteriales bacterium]
MRISEKFKHKKPLVSFEIFPPKVGYSIDTIYKTIDDLNDLNPDFMSVTYGAGGTTKDRTVEIASYIKKNYDLSSIPHITCINSTKREVEKILKSLQEKGIKNIMALRGDYPLDGNKKSINKGEFKHSTELIEFFKENSDLSIGAACYPEKHPESPDLETDLKYLKKKVDCGADFLVTQMFFDNEFFYNFLDKTQAKSIDIPIIAGIMPILNKSQVKTVSKLTGNNLPKKFVRILERYEDNPEALKEAGLSYAIGQIIDLLSWGVDGVHIYTMNKSDTARNIMESMKAIRGVLTDEK